MSHDAYHDLLSNRFVCEACLTKFFILYSRCPACDKIGRMRRMRNVLYGFAQNDTELRNMIAAGQGISHDWVVSGTGEAGT